MLNEKWYPLRVVTLLVTAIIISCVATNAGAQNPRSKTFPLNKEFTATIAVCATEEYAKQVAEEGPTAFQLMSLMGSCMGGQTQVKYLRLVYTSKDGKSNVYEVEIAGHKVFAITDWKHEST